MGFYLGGVGSGPMWITTAELEEHVLKEDVPRIAKLVFGEDWEKRGVVIRRRPTFRFADALRENRLGYDNPERRGVALSSISRILTSTTVNSAPGLTAKDVSSYRYSYERMMAGVPLEPAIVVQDDDDFFQVKEGSHRTTIASLLGIEYAPMIVLFSTLEDVPDNIEPLTREEAPGFAKIVEDSLAMVRQELIAKGVPAEVATMIDHDMRNPVGVLSLAIRVQHVRPDMKRLLKYTRTLIYTAKELLPADLTESRAAIKLVEQFARSKGWLTGKGG